MSDTIDRISNGKPSRKTLTRQLDRIDKMLDGLDQGLKETIADAMKESVAPTVAEAVRITLLELVTNPNVLEMMHGNGMIPAASEVREAIIVPSAELAIGDRLGNRMAHFGRQVMEHLRAVCHTLGWPFRKLYAALIVVAHRAAEAKRPLLAGMIVGLVAGALSSIGAPWIAGMIGGVGAVGATFGGQLARWNQRAFALAAN